MASMEGTEKLDGTAGGWCFPSRRPWWWWWWWCWLVVVIVVVVVVVVVVVQLVVLVVVVVIMISRADSHGHTPPYHILPPSPMARSFHMFLFNTLFVQWHFMVSFRSFANSSPRPLATAYAILVSEIGWGLFLYVFTGSEGKHLFHRIGWKGRSWQLRHMDKGSTGEGDGQ